MHKFHKISSRSLLGRGGCSLSEYDPLYSVVLPILVPADSVGFGVGSYNLPNVR
jgi:hypothetical protein